MPLRPAEIAENLLEGTANAYRSAEALAKRHRRVFVSLLGAGVLIVAGHRIATFPSSDDPPAPATAPAPPLPTIHLKSPEEWQEQERSHQEWLQRRKEVKRRLKEVEKALNLDLSPDEDLDEDLDEELDEDLDEDLAKPPEGADDPSPQDKNGGQGTGPFFECGGDICGMG